VQTIVFCFAAISVAASTLSFSQTITSGDVTGTVSDSSGGVVPNATVTIQSAATGTSNAVQSGGDGAYGFNFVSPGRYQLSAVRRSVDAVVKSKQVVAFAQVAKQIDRPRN
jgi:hypothetical protein